MRGRCPSRAGLSPFVGAQTPSLKWTFEGKGNANNGFAAIAADGTIYYTPGPHLYAMKSDGTVKWSSPAGFTFLSSPAIAVDGTIYVGADHGKQGSSGGAGMSSGVGLYAFNPDGSQKWTFVYSGGRMVGPAIGVDGTIYLGSDEGHLYAIDMGGAQKWSFAGPDSPPAIGADGTIYARGPDALYAVNPDGSKKWAHTISTGLDYDEGPTSAIASDGTIYLSTLEHGVHALNPDGTEKWVFDVPGGAVGSPFLGPDGSVYVSPGYLYAINPDGTQRWAVAGDHIAAVGADGTIYVSQADQKGNFGLSALLPDGTTKWQLTPPWPNEQWLRNGAIGADGTLYMLPIGGGSIFAFGP